MKCKPGDMIQFTFHTTIHKYGSTDDLYGIVIEAMDDGIQMGLYYKSNNEPVTTRDNNFTTFHLEGVIPYVKQEHGQYLLEF